MEDLRTIALDAALRLHQASRGREADPAPATALGLRYASPAQRRCSRSATTHRAVLCAIGLPADTPDEIDAGLSDVARDLLAVAGGMRERPMLERCIDFCLALREALGAAPVAASVAA